MGYVPARVMIVAGGVRLSGGVYNCRYHHLLVRRRGQLSFRSVSRTFSEHRYADRELVQRVGDDDHTRRFYHGASAEEKVCLEKGMMVLTGDILSADQMPIRITGVRESVTLMSNGRSYKI